MINLKPNLSNLSFKAIIGSKVFFVLGIIIMIFLALQVGQEGLKKYETSKEIDRLQKEADKVQQNQKKLESLNQFLQSNFFAEQEARSKLNLQKPNEKAIIIQEGQDSVSPIEKNDLKPSSENKAIQPDKKQIALIEEVKQNKNNPQKWWDYFFAKK